MPGCVSEVHVSIAEIKLVHGIQIFLYNSSLKTRSRFKPSVCLKFIIYRNSESFSPLFYLCATRKSRFKPWIIDRRFKPEIRNRSLVSVTIVLPVHWFHCICIFIIDKCVIQNSIWHVNVAKISNPIPFVIRNDDNYNISLWFRNTGTCNYLNWMTMYVALWRTTATGACIFYCRWIDLYNAAI
jgi:hypothetical protein